MMTHLFHGSVTTVKPADYRVRLLDLTMVKLYTLECQLTWRKKQYACEYEERQHILDLLFLVDGEIRRRENERAIALPIGRASGKWPMRKR